MLQVKDADINCLFPKSGFAWDDPALIGLIVKHLDDTFQLPRLGKLFSKSESVPSSSYAVQRAFNKLDALNAKNRLVVDHRPHLDVVELSFTGSPT